MRVLLKGRTDMDIKQYIVPLDTILNEANRYYAHVKSDENETLIEHSNRCLKYLDIIYKEKHLENILEKIMKTLYLEYSDAFKNIFLEVFYNAITMHDLGKINPEFQKVKMNNDVFEKIKGLEVLNSKHSLLSAFIYLEYYLKKVQTLPKEEQKFIKDIIYINAYVISRHHTSMKELKSDFLEIFYQGNPIQESIMTGFSSISFQQIFKYEFHLSLMKTKGIDKFLRRMEQMDETQSITLYSYTRLLYSLIVACDYYATSEFNGGIEIQDIGNIHNAKDLIKEYEQSSLITKIRNTDINSDEEDINSLRTKIFLEAEKELIKHSDDAIYYLEAPTGSGKSNTALNLSLKLIEMHPDINKIFYVYPFNTLVEQNMAILKGVFGNNDSIMKQITIVNSTVPIPLHKEGDNKYKYALLDRQFLNYPFILTTHVSLFDTLFGNYRESFFGFYQIANTVIVLDEIQSYRIACWNEMIVFLKQYAYLFNIKIIIMSATLPNLEILSTNKEKATFLIKDRDYYFQHPLFKDRVHLNYDLLKEKNSKDKLLEHVLESIKLNKKIMIEFITRKSAEEFYRILKSLSLECEILYTCGQDSIIERERIIDKVKKSQYIVLVATQVVEAGIDIDMDIGYKDISKLDSEEQFMGRINRSCKKEGIVYFFNLDNANMIYKQDNRANMRDFTLENKDMQEILTNKNFVSYYNEILALLKKDGEMLNEQNLKQFFNDVGNLYFEKVKKRMELIKKDQERITIFLGRVIVDKNGKEYDGRSLWQEYRRLLNDYELEYSKKMYKLSVIKSEMNYFMYEINVCKFDYDEQIGNIYYIDEGEKYILDDKLNMEYFDNTKQLFI